MSKKLPLAIQRAYSINDKGPEWHLSCLVCDKAWKLQKPGKGEKIHGGNILHLLDHAASHTVAEEAEEAPEPLVELVSESAPNSHVGPVATPNKLKYGYPSEKHPNAYKVEVFRNVTKVSNFRDQTYTKYRQVEKVDGGHTVTLFAANSKHASLIGQRIIERHINENKAE